MSAEHDDLIARLNRHTAYLAGQNYSLCAEAMRDAAFEIARLNAALDEARAEYLRRHNEAVDHYEARVAAERKAAEARAAAIEEAAKVADLYVQQLRRELGGFKAVLMGLYPWVIAAWIAKAIRALSHLGSAKEEERR